MKIQKYPDGSSYVTIESTTVPSSLIYNSISFRINNYEDLWHLNQFVDAYNSKYGAAPNIVIPNLIDAQADRRFEKDQSSGLKLVCQFLNSMNARFTIFHPHNPEVIEALMDNVKIIDNSEFISQILSNLYLSKECSLDKDNLGDLGWNSNNLILMSSDAGGYKPLMKLCNKIGWGGETFSASKARLTDGTILQTIGETDFVGKDILIVDDICVYGGTFKGLSKKLKERNCGKLYLAVSHMTVQDLGRDPVTNYFDKVFTTNSKYDNYISEYFEHTKKVGYKKSIENLEIIKMFEYDYRN